MLRQSVPSPASLPVASAIWKRIPVKGQGNNVKRLTGDWAGYFRYRVGDWRVIYRIDDDESRLDVVVIAHLRAAYG